MEGKKNYLLSTGVPVLVPPAGELTTRAATFVASLVTSNDNQGTISLVVRRKPGDDVEMGGDGEDVSVVLSPSPQRSAFMQGLKKTAAPTLDGSDGKMLTENGDVTYSTAGHALVDLFYSLDKTTTGDKLRDLLNGAWKTNPDATLKLVWNARSIHLGKADKEVCYRAIGWLYEQHPATLLQNLQWLVRPVIAKKTPSKEEKQDKNDKQEIVMVNAEDAGEEFEMVETHEDVTDETPRKKIKLDKTEDGEKDFEVKYGVSHGYWKDLLNMVALAANDELKVDGDIRKILNPARPPQSRDKNMQKRQNRKHQAAKYGKSKNTTTEEAKEPAKKLPSEQQPWERNWSKGGERKALRNARYESAMEKLDNDPKYTALYLTVARLFAEQLKIDMARLGSKDTKEQKLITLCGKWAPSHDGMHDEHAFIVSTIAEMLFDFNSVCPDIDPGDRTLYLKHARQTYQDEILSKLRAHLNIVERQITEGKFADIKYDRVPSVAMQQYTTLFAKKDTDGFDRYLENVAKGKDKISGATLTPAKLIHLVRLMRYRVPKDNSIAKSVDVKVLQMEQKSAELQWKALVQRTKDSGVLSSSIAVCDVSGSMEGPRCTGDDCSAMDASIGLSLLIAEVTEPPFGGAFITFSTNPAVVSVGGETDKRSLQEKISYIEGSNWTTSTDFVAVFEKLILPMARDNNLTQEQMVKRVFVFSDMQFNSADAGSASRWSTSYERIKGLYKGCGYKMPELVFWNLSNDHTAGAIPVDAAEEGCSLVSGYSQGMLKTFLEGGEVESEEAEEEEEEVVEGEEVKRKQKKSPLETVMKAISADGYRMLKVVD